MSGPDSPRPAVPVWMAALLWLLVFSLPVEKAVQIPGLGTISRTIGLAAFACGLATVARRGALRPPNAALLLAAALAAWTCATWFWSVDRGATTVRIATVAQLFGMTWLIWELALRRQVVSRLMQAYLGGAVLSAVWTLVRAANNQQTYYRRFATAGFDPNDLGVTLVLALPMAFYFSLRWRGWRGAAARGAALLLVAGILLTASRTAVVGAYVAFLLPVITWRGSGRSHRFFTVALLAVLMVGPTTLAPRARQRLADITSEVTSGTFNNRKRIWKAGIRLLKRRLPVGVGAAAFPEAVAPYIGRSPIVGQPYTAHNTFLSVLVETGLPGFTLLGLLLATLAWYAWVAGGVERILWGTMLAVWATSVFTLSWESRKPTWLLIALIMATWADTFRERGKGLEP
jgi:O-antigen ligase